MQTRDETCLSVLGMGMSCMWRCLCGGNGGTWYAKDKEKRVFESNIEKIKTKGGKMIPLVFVWTSKDVFIILWVGGGLILVAYLLIKAKIEEWRDKRREKKHRKEEE